MPFQSVTEDIIPVWSVVLFKAGVGSGAIAVFPCFPVISFPFPMLLYTYMKPRFFVQYTSVLYAASGSTLKLNSDSDSAACVNSYVTEMGNLVFTGSPTDMQV